MSPEHLPGPLWSYGVVLLACVGGCSVDCLTPPGSEDPDDRPLQPLVYTESADASPKAAAVREQRLLRQLQSSARQSGSWGGLGAKREDLPTLSTSEALGDAIGRALLERDESLWSHVFVPPAGYGKLVNLESAPARRFVDEQRGASRDVWRAFDVDTPSKLPPSKLSAVFETGNLELGKPRTLDANLADEQDRPIQYWNNRLTLNRPNAELQFEIRIPKIIRIPPALSTSGEPRFGIASDLSLGDTLQTFLDAGLHFDADVLSGAAYPFPMNVGNFWKYNRRIEPLKHSKDDSATTNETTLLVEVMEVDRFRSWRVIHLRSIRLNRRGGRQDIRWLLTPKKIFPCDSTCRHYADDLDRLLSYIDRHTPVFDFPVRLGTTWGSGNAVIRAADTFDTVSNPAGQFSGTIALHGTAARADWTVGDSVLEATLWFAPRTGIIKRRFVLPASRADQGRRVVEDTLTEYRLMER